MITVYVDSYQANAFDYISCYQVKSRPMPAAKPSSEKQSSSRKMYGIRLPESLMRDVKHLAVDEGKPMNELVEEGLRDLMRKYKEKKK
jgi:hypothetical protein